MLEEPASSSLASELEHDAALAWFMRSRLLCSSLLNTAAPSLVVGNASTTDISPSSLIDFSEDPFTQWVSLSNGIETGLPVVDPVAEAAARSSHSSWISFRAGCVV